MSDPCETLRSLVENEFQFLMEEFGFDILRQVEDGKRSFYSGSVRMGSGATVIEVIVDRGVLGSPTFGRREDVADFGIVAMIPFDRIYECQTISDRDQRQIASRDPEKMTRAFRESIETRLLELRNMGMADGGFASTDLRIEYELQVYSRLIAKFAEPYIRGDFSNWLQLCEYVWYWLMASELANERSWGEELTLENVERRFSNSVDTLSICDANMSEDNPSPIEAWLELFRIHPWPGNSKASHIP